MSSTGTTSTLGRSPGPVRAGLLAGGAGLLLAVVLSGCGGGSSPGAAPTSGATTQVGQPSSSDTYGGYPSFLPSGTTGSNFGNGVVNASAAHPALATQGDTVRVHVGTTSVLATVSGPAVPVEGQAYQSPTSPVTFSVELRSASKPFRVDPATFQAIDESGAVHDFRVQGHAPRVLRPGQVARFHLFSASFETGEGRFRWIPVGHLAPVEWDFVVETD